MGLAERLVLSTQDHKSRLRTGVGISLIPVAEPIIKIQDVDFAYGSRLVLKHISMAIRPGTTLGVTGPNGGGKTTLIQLLLGLLTPTRGTIQIDGLSPRRAVRQGDVVGYLPQSPPITANFPINVGQFIRLGLTGKIG